MITWVSDDAFREWCAGSIWDAELLRSAPVWPAPGQSFFVIDLASPRELRRLRAWAQVWLPQIKSFSWCCRTRVPMVERICVRLGGRVCFDELDGDRRWIMPGDQLREALRGNCVSKVTS